ncbi:unnamed protein product [Chondrus crispus]|uniref:RING-type domain-containing protein n=1 Tax=Chondrus crispus TaxID=2769 RepID=R7Q5N8_CHOCR|nr:unnamed protein product [Chondrus crispus]CDF33847.1 unnamed protein product [Chondrus crispus]|eukprot:XP_005713666.1 unnamed protein product [Chondrus crispus]
MAAVRSSQTLDEEEAAVAHLAHLSVVAAYSDEHDSDEDDDRTPPVSPLPADDPPPDAACVVCFERQPNVTLDPCGHANLCDVCVSRLVKRRCPTCRARARKVAIQRPGEQVVTKGVREVIQERKLRESKVLEDTLQVVFLGPEKVGKKTLVRKLISKFPHPTSQLNEDHHSELDVFSDGTDFSANAAIYGANVRLTVLRRTTLTSRRMVLDDVRVLKPDVLVLCCSAHVGATFNTILSWDKVLRNNFQKPRLWALLTLDDKDGPATTKFDTAHDVSGAISAIIPTDLRPKSHHICSLGEQFSIGFRSLPKDIVSLGRIARDQELAASIALEEARSLADHEAAGTIGDQAAAELVRANNGIEVPSSSTSVPGHGSRGGNSSRGNGVGRSFSLRGFRERNSNNPNGSSGQGISVSNFFNWLAGSHES